MADINIFSEENLLAQLNTAEYKLGFYRVRFYTLNGKLAETETGEISEFFLYPSGGALRDKDFNIVFYSSKFDIYRGFRLPHFKN